MSRKYALCLASVNNDYRAAWRFIFGLEIPAPLTKLDLAALLLEPIRGNQDRMISQYKNTLKEGKKVILISHSQGNFFAEEAINSIAPDGDPMQIGFGNVRVATPAYSSYDFPYTTFEDDFIIKAVRNVAGAPPANLPPIGSGPVPRDPLGHDFVKAYLGTERSRIKIKTDIASVEKQTQYPFHGDAFSVEISSKDEDGLTFEMSAGNEDEPFQRQNANSSNQSYAVACKNIKDGKYAVVLKTAFIEESRCPCKFKIKITHENQEDIFEATYKLSRQKGGKKYHLIEGSMPVLTIKKRSGDFGVTVEKRPYPAVLLN